MRTFYATRRVPHFMSAEVTPAATKHVVHFSGGVGSWATDPEQLDLFDFGGCGCAL